MEGIIHPSPYLFDNDGITKSSKDLLAILCKDYIHGIGNLTKHLDIIGISVSHTQSIMEELDFSTSNMAIDLCDGTRLVKLAEILGGDSKSSILKNYGYLRSRDYRKCIISGLLCPHSLIC